MIPQPKQSTTHYNNPKKMTSIELLKPDHAPAWDAYVYKHPQATFCHLSGWKNIIEKAYRHKAYYLVATEDTCPTKTKDLRFSPWHKTKIVGLLPLIHLKHFFFGNSLISMPFLDYGGILADNKKIEGKLVSAAIKLAKKLKATNLELRHITPLSCLHDSRNQPFNLILQTLSHKVSMALQVPNNPETLMQSFKSKLRNQIKKPIKGGCAAVVGSVDLLDDFYKVFSANMRDLGSPVHSKKFIEHVLNEFHEARICLVYKGNRALAAGVIIGFKNRLNNPWASSLHKFSRLSPNMLLYWTMLDYACSNGYHYFDLGRSSLGDGTYEFKTQWGACAAALHWHYISTNGKKPVGQKKNFAFNQAATYWQKLPVTFTRVLGPPIRKYIGL